MKTSVLLLAAASLLAQGAAQSQTTITTTREAAPAVTVDVPKKADADDVKEAKEDAKEKVKEAREDVKDKAKDAKEEVKDDVKVRTPAAVTPPVTTEKRTTTDIPARRDGPAVVKDKTTTTTGPDAPAVVRDKTTTTTDAPDVVKEKRTTTTDAPMPKDGPAVVRDKTTTTDIPARRDGPAVVRDKTTTTTDAPDVVKEKRTTATDAPMPPDRVVKDRTTTVTPGSPEVIRERRTTTDAPMPADRVVRDRTTVVTPGSPEVIRERRTTSNFETGPRYFVEQNRGLPGLVVDRRLDRTIVRRQLSIAPKVVTMPALPAPPAGVEVRKTTTTTTDGAPAPLVRRVYQPERNVVIVEGENKEARELPFVAVPVLFQQDSAELLDQESAQAIKDMADTIKEVIGTESSAVFDVEGHTSTEGTDEHNMDLSGKRAQKVLDDLTKLHAVPATALTAHGYGENYPNHPNGSEEELALDRRVLVVRSK